MICKKVIIGCIITLFSCNTAYSEIYDDYISDTFKQCSNNNSLSNAEHIQCYEDEHNQLFNKLNKYLSSDIYNNSKISQDYRNTIKQNQDKWIIVHNEMNDIFLTYIQQYLGHAGIRFALNTHIQNLIKRRILVEYIAKNITSYDKNQDQKLDSIMRKMVESTMNDQRQVYKDKHNQLIDKMDSLLSGIYKNSKIESEYKNNIKQNQTKWIDVHNELNTILLAYSKYAGTDGITRAFENSLNDAEERYKWLQLVEENVSSYLELQADMAEPEPAPKPEPKPASQSKSKSPSAVIPDMLEYDDVIIGSIENYKVVKGEYSVDFTTDMDDWHFQGNVNNAFHAYLKAAVDACAKGGFNTVAVLFSMNEAVGIVPVSQRQLYIQPNPVIRDKHAIIGVCEPESDDCGKLKISKTNPQYKQVTDTLPGREATVFFTEGGEVAACYPVGN